MKRLYTLSLFLCSVIFSFAQTFTGGGGAISYIDTSRYNIVVSGLPTSINNSFGLVSLKLNAVHGHIRDIDCFLVAPDGTFIEITTDNGGTNGADFTNTVFRDDAPTSITTATGPCTGTFLPEGYLNSSNNNQNPNGTWQLRVIDDQPANGYTGSLTNWSLTFGNNPPAAFSESNLPIVVINTLGQTIVDDPKIICNMGIIDNGIGNRNHLVDAMNGYNGKIAIEVRGSSSQMFPKKTFGFETRTTLNTLLDTNVSLVGMPLEHDWVLSASYTDKSLMRNFLSYQLGNEMGHWAPHCKYVDVVMNGQYWGVYILMEKIKRDNNRVDISRLSPTEVAYPEISGGYILKIDKTTGTDGHRWYSPYPPINHPNGQQIGYEVEYPDVDSLSLPQIAYIKSYVDSFESALSGPNYMDSALGYSKFIGNRSFIDYFFIEEVSKNVDGYRLSQYLYKDKEKTLKCGPLWDFDIAYGNANYCSGYDTTGWAWQFPCTTDSWQVPFWWPRLLSDSNYTNQTKCRWLDYRQNILSNQHINFIIDSVASLLSESQAWNFQKWPILGIYIWPNVAPYPTTYAGEVSNLKKFLATRLAWLDANMPGNCDCSLATTFKNATCFNACDGEIAALATSPYPETYIWDNGAEGDTLTFLCPGTYNLTAINGVDCARSVTITITEPSTLASTITASTNASCNASDGSATISVSGGTGSYTYAWSTSPTQTTETASGLSTGTYSVTITDANNCSTVQTVTINPVSQINILMSSKNVGCNGNADGEATATATGGTGNYTYSWTTTPEQTTETATGLSAGTYSVTITDENNCSNNQSVTIAEPAILSATINSVNASCFESLDGEATANITGGTSAYTYSWNTTPEQTTQTATGLSAGTYSVTIIDAHGCGISQQANIFEPTLLSQNTSSASATCPTCTDGIITVNGTGGTSPYIYTIDGSGAQGTPDFLNLLPGTYNICVEDASGCTDCADVVVGISSVGIANVGGENYSLQVSPNPSDGIFTVSMNNSFSKINSVAIIDVTGRVIVKKENLSVAQISFDEKNLSKGIYFLKIISGDKILLKKISIE
jgi:hypothetical protein